MPRAKSSRTKPKARPTLQVDAVVRCVCSTCRREGKTIVGRVKYIDDDGKRVRIETRDTHVAAEVKYLEVLTNDEVAVAELAGIL